VSSIDFIDRHRDSHDKHRHILKPVHFPKKSKKQVKFAHQRREVVPKNEVDHDFDDDAVDRIETDSDLECGTRHLNDKRRHRVQFTNDKL